ncbi:MAG: hypothetical protein AB8B74_11425 [Crocinitomicaceae bacterium]
MPIVFGISIIIIKKIKKRRIIHINFATTTFLALYFALIFELVLPLNSSVYTSDFYDVMMYLLGAYLYYFIQFDSCQIKADDCKILA